MLFHTNLTCVIKKAGNLWNPRNNPRPQGRKSEFHGNISWSWCSVSRKKWLSYPLYLNSTCNVGFLSETNTSKWEWEAVWYSGAQHLQMLWVCMKKIPCLERLRTIHLFILLKYLIVHWTCIRPLQWTLVWTTEVMTCPVTTGYFFFCSNHLSSRAISFRKVVKNVCHVCLLKL